jgi:hypothetical protein
MTTAKTKIPVVLSDTIELSDGDNIRCQKARGIVDAIEVFAKVTKTAGSAERMTWARFKPADPGVHRIKWDVAQGGVGRIVVRADLLARELRSFKRGKCAISIAIAEDLDKQLPGADLVSDHIETPMIEIEDVDPSRGTLMPRAQSLMPSRNDVQSSVAGEIARLAGSFVPQEALQSFARKQMEAQHKVLEYQTEHAKALLDDRRLTEKLAFRIKTAREFNDTELEKALKKQFLES